MGSDAKAASAGALGAIPKSPPHTGPIVQVLTTPNLGVSALLRFARPISLLNTGIDLHEKTQHLLSCTGSSELPPLLTEEAVSRTTSLPISTLRALRAAGEFPAAVQLTPRRIAFRTEDVMRWVASRPVAAPKAHVTVKGDQQ